MTGEELLWREAVGAELEGLRWKRANRGRGFPTYRTFQRRFAAHHREGLRLGIRIDDDLLFKCSMERQRRIQS